MNWNLSTQTEYWVVVVIYLLLVVLVLWLWRSVAKALPQPLGKMSWVVMFALLLAPTLTDGVSPHLAPATVALLFGIVIKNKALILSSLLPILIMTTVGFLLGFLYDRFAPHRPRTPLLPAAPELGSLEAATPAPEAIESQTPVA